VYAKKYLNKVVAIWKNGRKSAFGSVKKFVSTFIRSVYQLASRYNYLLLVVLFSTSVA